MTAEADNGNDAAPKEGEESSDGAQQQGKPEPPDGGKGDEKSVEEQLAALESENNRLKRIISDRDKADRKAAEKKAADEGKHEEAARLAQERAEKAEADLATERRTTRGLRVAGELKFNNPATALKLIDPEDLDDDAKAKRALEKLAKDEPGLLAGASQRRSAPIGEGAPPNADMNAWLRQQAGRG